MKSGKSLQRAQQAMRRRLSTGRGPGRPRLHINKYEVEELLLKGYSVRGIAIALGCSVRTLERRFSPLLRMPLDPSMSSGSVLFKLAVREHDHCALLYLGEQLAEEDARNAAEYEIRAEQEEEELIQRRIREQHD